MTTKELNSELEEIFEHKYALLEKIDHNRNEIDRIGKAIEIEPSKREKLRLKGLAKKGRALIAHQMTERKKLTAKKIAQELGMKDSFTVRYRYELYLNNKAFN